MRLKLIWFGLVLSVSTSIWAANAPNRLTVLVSNANSMPMLELKHDQPSDGILKDVADSLGQAMQREVHFHVLPRKRIGQELESGQADVYCYTNPQWLNADVLWSVPIISNYDVVVTRADTSAPTQLNDLKAKPLGTVLGYRYPEIELALGKDFKRDDGLTEQQNLQKMLARRFDYLLMSEVDFLFQKRKFDQGQLNMQTLRFSRYDNYCALSRKSPIKLEELNAAIIRLKKSQQFTAIQARYR